MEIKLNWDIGYEIIDSNKIEFIKPNDKDIIDVKLTNGLIKQAYSIEFLK